MLTFYKQYLGTDLANIHLKITFNNEFRLLICVIYIYSKYAEVILLKDKKRNYNY